MATITYYGNYLVPAARVGIVLDHLIAVVKKHPKTFSKDEFVEEIGASPSSNGPSDKLRDMIRYGLIARSDGQYTITELAKAAISDNPSERAAAKEKVIRNIEIWNLLLEKVGTHPTVEIFTQAVQQIADKTIEQRDINRMWYSYNEDIACISKNPPYSNRSAILGKQRKPKIRRKHNFTPEVSAPEVKKLDIQLPHTQNNRQSEKLSELPEPWGNLLKYLINKEKLLVEFGSVKFEVKDNQSLKLAKALIAAKEGSLLLGDDYE